MKLLFKNMHVATFCSLVGEFLELTTYVSALYIIIIICIIIIIIFKLFGRTNTHVLFWSHWYSCFWFLVMLFTFVEMNVMYIPQDLPLLLHLPTSWQSASQPVTSPPASTERGIGSDSHGQFLSSYFSRLVFDNIRFVKCWLHLTWLSS